MNTKSKKYGIFGGSFDPVHNGHLILCSYAMEALKLDFLYVVPAFNPPHKDIVEAPFDKRTEWLKKAFVHDKRVIISTFEAEKGGLSYTIETVRYFTKRHHTPPYLLIGEDSARNIESWFKFQELLKEAFIVVYPRFEKNDSLINSSLLNYENRGISFLKAPLIQLSATEIRQRIKGKKSILGMIPESILPEVVAFYEKKV
ncbi:hypothetical protein AT15_02580 [Kosmotoga arenicorallina S304]|uniref:Probable nicotinate-nucleotide adenylyltransferase n=1 Tax=Kosmotoga arenicorallina S304 TaxID=1453497 RepID=A0A182C7R2_9BACT|nr:nicotinate (nicotinamide) nucleotide adenylyltransferase [Kosmotoga arenicorallina]OAA31730.1 hypothetical protein AT15_02580 [Kosmotoga arenicorallina S304]